MAVHQKKTGALTIFVATVLMSVCGDGALVSAQVPGVPGSRPTTLEPGGVRIRAYFWSPTRGVDWFQLRSDANLKAKVGLELAGVLGPAVAASPATVDSPPRIVQNDKPHLTIRVDQAAANLRHDAVDQASASLRRDARATVSLTPVTGDGCATPLEQVLEQPETRVSDEGVNLLKGNRPE
jgi:small conductance mechanosensitive channel